MKRLTFLFLTIFITSCSGSDSGDDVIDNSDTPQSNAPGNVTLKSPANGKVCETGTSISNLKSTVDFSWEASSNTDTYDIQVTNINTASVINKTDLSIINTTIELEKGQPYIWNVISKSSSSSQTGISPSWKFYLAGTGIKNYAPFPADLKNPKSGSTVQRSSEGKVTFSWEGSDPDDGDQLTYTLYVDKVDGKQSPPSEQVNISENDYDLSLDAEAIYFLRIKTSDGINSSFSLVYSFRTE